MTDIPEHIVERVAKAIAGSLNAKGFTAYPSDFEKQARAAIEALGGKIVFVNINEHGHGAVCPGRLKPQGEPAWAIRPYLLIPLNEESD